MDILKNKCTNKWEAKLHAEWLSFIDLWDVFSFLFSLWLWRSLRRIACPHSSAIQNSKFLGLGNFCKQDTYFFFNWKENYLKTSIWMWVVFFYSSGHPVVIFFKRNWYFMWYDSVFFSVGMFDH